MTTVQRNAITGPTNGLLVLNTTTNTLDISLSSSWKSFEVNAATFNLVYVYSLADLPTPAGSTITLDATKMYVFSGIVNIAPNHLNLNGTGLRGNDPSKDGVMSNVAGAVLRSTNVSVFMENFAVLPLTAATQAYDFSGTVAQFCNLFSGNSVIDSGVGSLGVGQITGFRAITVLKNYWKCNTGVKIGGTIGKLTVSYTFIADMPTGTGVEILGSANISDIDLANNYFENILTGVKVNTSIIDRGRMTTNMFRNVTNFLIGFDSFTREWEMIQNTNVPNSRATAYTSMDANGATTNMINVGQYYKIEGITAPISNTSLKRFTTSNNRLTYTGKDNITAKVRANIGVGGVTGSASDYSISIFKNGTPIGPVTSNATAGNNQAFQIALNMELEMISTDFIEVFIRRNAGTTNFAIDNLQFQATD